MKTRSEISALYAKLARVEEALDEQDGGETGEPHERIARLGARRARGGRVVTVLAEPFRALVSGEKSFLVIPSEDASAYRVGDALVLREWEGYGATGETRSCVVTFVERGGMEAFGWDADTGGGVAVLAVTLTASTLPPVATVA